jgi:hypothetical protein
VSEQNTTSGRSAEVDTAVGRIAEKHPYVRDALDALRGHLGRAHADTAHADDRTWAEYRDRLDRGLDELDAELARVGEPTDGSVPDALFVKATQLEIDGWRLHFETRQERLAAGVPSEIDRLRALSAAAEGQIDAYRRGECTRAHVEQAMNGLRDTAK